jgi:uncharacterized protein (DUF362 family)
MSVLLVNGTTSLKAALHRILEYFPASTDYSRGIFLKPNIVFPVRENSGQITPLSLVKTLISALRERSRTADIVIGEGVAAGCDASENFRISGFARLARDLGVPLVDLDVCERVSVPWKYGTLELPRLAIERTYLNLPILKPSSAAGISGAMKNQKGLILPQIKKQFHKLGLHEPLLELNRVIQPNLTILDCRHFFKEGAFVAGINTTEIDVAVCQMLDIEPPAHVKLALDAGLCRQEIELTGDYKQSLKPSQVPHARQFHQYGRIRVWSNPRACSMCRYVLKRIRTPTDRESLVAGFKLAKYALRGADIVMGSKPEFTKTKSTLICLGDCTKKVASQLGGIHVPGCPPSVADLVTNL